MDTEKNGNAYEYSRVEEIIMGIIVVGMIVGSILSQVFGFLQLPLTASIGWIIGGVLLLFGLTLLVLWAYMWSKYYKGQLITHGIYKYLRHPHYMSAILLFIGVSFFFRSIISLILAIFLSVAIVRGIDEEEEHLIKQYGVAYEEYINQTKWKLIPMIY
jgi:protein-S-isoprenylcysteine O-methyltransferase Ste14